MDTGGAALAAEVGAVSADHLMAASDKGIEAMARAGVCATLLPGTSFYLRKAYAPARKFVEAGCAVALSTDCNPGSSYTTNLLHVATLGVFGLGLMPEEALWAVTLNAAYALREHDQVGSIAVGKRADLSVWRVALPPAPVLPLRGESAARGRSAAAGRFRGELTSQRLRTGPYNGCGGDSPEGAAW